MVIPDRVVQIEGVVALAPRIAGAFVLVDNQRRHAEPLQARAQRDPTLTTANNDAIRLFAVAEARFFVTPRR